MSVAINSSPAGALNSSNCWKRKGSDDETRRRYDVKRSKYSWYYTLERESSDATEEDQESIYTIQGHETEFARDTSDTSTHTWLSSCSDSDDSDAEVQVEYEIDSGSESDNAFDQFSSASDPEDIIEVDFISFCNSDGQADDSADSTSTIDSDVKTADFRTCVQCKNPNNNSLFPYCEKCYQLKKFYFPRSRPRRIARGSKDANGLKKLLSPGGGLVVGGSGSSIKTSTCASLVTSTQELTDMDSGIGSSQCDSISGSSQELTAAQSSSLQSFNSQSSLASTVIATPSFSASSLTEAVASPRAFPEEEDDSGEATDNSQRSNASATTVELGPSESCAASPRLPPEEKHEENGALPVNEYESDLSDNWYNDSTTANEQVDEEGAALLALVKKHSDNRPRGGQPIVEICQICMERPMNGCFPHDSIGHITYCYKCASKIWQTNGHRCPICNVKTGKVIKVFK